MILGNDISTFQDFQVLKCVTSSGCTKILEAYERCIYGVLFFSVGFCSYLPLYNFIASETELTFKEL